MSTRRKLATTLRRQVMARAEYQCEYCRAPETFSLDTFEVDHIQPVAEDGGDTLDNLAFACRNCNNRKQDAMVAIDPETNQSVPLYHPRHDHWRDHFAWSEDAL